MLQVGAGSSLSQRSAVEIHERSFVRPVRSAARVGEQTEFFCFFHVGNRKKKEEIRLSDYHERGMNVF